MSQIQSAVMIALFSLLFQSVVFSSGHAVGEVLRLATSPKYLGFVGSMVLLFSVALSAVAYGMDSLIPFFKRADSVTKGVEYAGILFILFIIVIVVLRFSKVPQKYIKRTSIAAFNTLVLSVPFVNSTQGYTLIESVANGAGTALSFVLATVLISGGVYAAQSEKTPRAFRGIPALLIFIGILSMAFFGFAS